MLDHKKEGVVIVLSGPSGAGKGTLCEHLREKIDINYSISATTRAPRPGEKDKVNYFFMTREAFKQKIKDDGFLEWAEVYNNFYGTPLDYVEQQIAAGKDVMVEIDPQGAKQVKLKKSDAVLVFIMPPSFAELERRIRGRDTETEEQIRHRLGNALNEINTLTAYDYVIVNDNIDEATADLQAIINAEKCRVERNSRIPHQFRVEKEKEHDSTEY